MFWFLDLDDTLATGLFTWAMEYGFSNFVATHHLTLDEPHLNQVLFNAQQTANDIIDPTAPLHDIFQKLGWPQSLEPQFLDLVRSHYVPALFADTLPFLTSLRQHRHNVYLLSNNPRSQAIAQNLGIASYFTAIISPQSFGADLKKPSALLWESILAQRPEVDPAQAVIVGDDPWSDGLFAENCNLTCWIIDRRDRFMSLRAQNTHHWVKSLLDISVSGVSSTI